MDVTFNDIVQENDTIPLAVGDYRSGQHILYNESDYREFHFIVNGAWPEPGVQVKSRTLKFVAHRCVGDDCFIGNKLEDGIEVETEPRYWSKAEHWHPNRTTALPFPEEGEDLIIE